MAMAFDADLVVLVSDMALEAKHLPDVKAFSSPAFTLVLEGNTVCSATLY
jgi:hypothetical protein